MILETVAKAKQLYDVSNDYAKARMASAKAEVSFDLILASRRKDLSKNLRSNAGIDALRLALLAENDPDVLKYYEDAKMYTAKYKGLELVRDAIKEQINVEKLELKLEIN